VHAYLADAVADNVVAALAVSQVFLKVLANYTQDEKLLL